MSKQEKVLAGLIGVGAVLAILYLMYEKNQAAGAGASAPEVGVTPPPSTLPVYPNAQPIKSGDITIVNGSAPDSLYNLPTDGNQLSDYGLGDLGEGCDCDPCAQVTTLQSKMTIPPAVFKQAVDNLKSYQQKRVSNVSHILGLPS